MQAVEYDAEEQWSVISARDALRQAGFEVTTENINDWLNEHKSEEHAYGEYEPVDPAKVTAILDDAR